MTIGLTKEKIIEGLSDTELKAETLEAIAEIITANNKLIEKQVTQVVMTQMAKGLRL